MSEECKDFISKMLTKDANKRPSAGELLSHPFIKSPSDDNKIEVHNVLNLKKFQGQNSLKKAALNILVRQLHPDELRELREYFQAADKDHSGTVTYEELKEMVKFKGLNYSDTEIEQIIKNVDNNGDGHINYSEFIAATIDIRRHLTEEKVNALFSHFNTDGKGSINAQELKQAFTKMGRELSDEEITSIIRACDQDGDEEISLEEFKAMLMLDVEVM